MHCVTGYISITTFIFLKKKKKSSQDHIFWQDLCAPLCVCVFPVWKNKEYSVPLFALCPPNTSSTSRKCRPGPGQPVCVDFNGSLARKKHKLIPKVVHVCSCTLEIYPTRTNKTTNQTKLELRKANFLISRAGRTAGERRIHEVREREKKPSLLVELLMRLQSKHLPYVWGFKAQEGVSLWGCLFYNTPLTCCLSGEAHPETSFTETPSN